MGELSNELQNKSKLIRPAVTIVFIVSTAIGILFLEIISLFSPDFSSVLRDIHQSCIFIFGITLTGLGLLIDEILIGVLLGQTQLLRNVIFAFTKLALLILTPTLLRNIVPLSGTLIYLTWLMGNLSSLIVLLILIIKKGVPLRSFLPTLVGIKHLRNKTIMNYILNISLQAPGLLLPLIVSTLYSIKQNAFFYTAWMISGILFVVPNALATVLYSSSSNDHEKLQEKLKFSIKVSVILGVVMYIGIVTLSTPVLGVFGPQYVSNSYQHLLILPLAIFPITVKSHYVAIGRIQNSFLRTIKKVSLTGVIELLCAVIGGLYGGVYGISLGWVCGLFIGVLILSPEFILNLKTRGTEAVEL